jgi:PAT family beta-lactamase induction signal transducer AmpG
LSPGDHAKPANAVAAEPATASGGKPRATWLDSLRAYRQPRVIAMIFLGFSAGLPFYLVFQTLTAWLRQEGIARSTIGMLSWVGLAYSFKFIWSPIVDRVPLPFLTRIFGKRRSWMLLAQAGIAVCIFNLSLSQPSHGVLSIAIWAVLLAFCAATQDIAMDAWRVESAPVSMQGAMAAGYQIGYRIALITASAGVLTIAGMLGWNTVAGYQLGYRIVMLMADFGVLMIPVSVGWHVGYAVMALLVGVGIVTTLLVQEPHPRQRAHAGEDEERVQDWLMRNPHLSQRQRSIGAWVIAAVVCPFLDYFRRYGLLLGLMLFAFAATYRLTEYTMGPMANPFYIDHGYALTEIARVVKVYGLTASLLGVVIAGILIARIGLVRSLIAGSVMIMLSNVGFSLLATTTTPTLFGLGFVNIIDNLAQALHGTALIAFLSSLTSPKYTATQYALLSSLYTMPGKLFFEGTSGFVVEAIGYPSFFLYTAALSLPALAILAWLVWGRKFNPEDERA